MKRGSCGWLSNIQVARWPDHWRTSKNHVWKSSSWNKPQRTLDPILSIRTNLTHFINTNNNNKHHLFYHFFVKRASKYRFFFGQFLRKTEKNRSKFSDFPRFVKGVRLPLWGKCVQTCEKHCIKFWIFRKIVHAYLFMHYRWQATAKDTNLFRFNGRVHQFFI